MLPELIKIFEFEGSTLYACQCTEREAISIAISRGLYIDDHNVIHGKSNRYVGHWEDGLLKLWA